MLRSRTFSKPFSPSSVPFPPQLNVFYNIRNDELLRRRRDAGEHEAFHLHVELSDHEMNSAHVHVCCR